MRLIRDAVGGVERYFLEPVDARVYAVVRIAYAVVSFCIVVEQWPMRAAIFTAEGVTNLPTGIYPYLPLRYVTSLSGVSVLMVAAAVAAVCTCLGLFTRAMVLYLYLWTFSYCVVGYPAEAGYDAIVRIAGFVLLVSPAQHAFALDSKIFGRGATEVPRYGLRLLQFQLCIIYLATVWLKAPDTYWRNGELMSYFMMSIYSRFSSPIWADLGRLSALMTWWTLAVETFVPFLLCSTRYRRWGFALGVSLHLGIGITSTIGMFSLTMAPLYASFLAAEDLDALQAFLHRLRRPRRAVASR